MFLQSAFVPVPFVFCLYRKPWTPPTLAPNQFRPLLPPNQRFNPRRTDKRTSLDTLDSPSSRGHLPSVGSYNPPYSCVRHHLSFFFLRFFFSVSFSLSFFLYFFLKMKPAHVLKIFKISTSSLTFQFNPGQMRRSVFGGKNGLF